MTVVQLSRWWCNQCGWSWWAQPGYEPTEDCEEHTRRGKAAR